VQILEHDQGRPTARFSKQCQKGVEDSIPVYCVERFSQSAVDRVGDVDQGSEGPSRNDGIARTPHDADITCRIPANGFDESCLADTGLTPDEDETPPSLPGFLQQAAQLDEQRCAL